MSPSLLSSATLLLMLGWLAVQGQESEPSRVRVSVDLFSGRKNPPAWSLTDKQVEELHKRFGLLPRAQANEKAKQPLGYRGMHLQISGKPLAGISRLHLFQGRAFAQEKGQEQTFVDKDRALERWLVRVSKDKLDPAIYKVLAEELHIEEPAAP